MKILVVHDRNRPYGGGEQYLAELCPTLRAHGCQVFVVSREGEGTGYFSCDASWTVPGTVGLRSGHRYWPQYAQILATANPDVIYVNGAAPWFLSPLILGRLVRQRPTVLFVHHIGLICPNGTKRLPDGTACIYPTGARCLREGCVVRLQGPLAARAHWFAAALWRLRAVRGCRQIVCPSRYVANEMCRNGYPAERVRVLPYFTSMHAEVPDHPPCEPRILWVGRFDGTKGFDVFLEALGRLHTVGWEAIVVGDDAGRPAAAAAVEQAGLAKQVRFVGRLDREGMTQAYMDCRLLAVTSLNAETFVIVGIEAMAHGRPVVAFAPGGVQEWLTAGETGFLVPSGDSRALAAGMDEVLCEDNLWLHLALAGQSRVEERFRPTSHMAELLAIFREAIACGERTGLA